MGERIKVLVVDDSAMVREILSKGLSLDPEIEVLGAAQNPYIARDMIVKLKPDVLTLDVEMPRMDGVEFLRRLMPQRPVPVVMVSALTKRGCQITLEAMDAGAVDFVTKPSMDVARGLNAMLGELREKVKIAAKANVSHWKGKTYTPPQKLAVAQKALAESTDKVIAIGASTGGTEAIRTVIQQFPPNAPGTVIVQHMPAGFTEQFAIRLNELSAPIVKEAKDGDRVMPGQILLAPGDYHMEVVRSGGIYRVKCSQGEKVSGHRPSVDVLFRSVAEHVGSNATGALLTGMGADGADGLLRMKEAGARTFAQDKASCVVFGMPMEAEKRGAAEKMVPLDQMANAILRTFMTEGA